VTQYRALYRTYRPQGFADVVGQGHVTETLAREVVAAKLGHAYLFAGPRGTGKTTTARILAKAINCPDRREDGEPCNVCLSCLAITEGSSMDVIELDAASHNKVEDVREIRANVGTVASVGGAKRVYILDEAHMLSRAAANALLKTLEEPPEHALFVLATTEPYKLPDTIRSRTQRFDFHPIGSEALIGHMGRIAEAEGMKASHDALALIARHAAGSARDALGLLEQVAALGGGTVDGKGVTRALGLAAPDAFVRLVTMISKEDAAGVLTLAAQIAAEGADLRRFVSDALELFRGLFLAQYAPNLAEIVDEPAEVIEEWKSLGAKLEPADVLRCIDRLGEALVQLREGREERLVVELALLQMTRPETATDAASLAGRLDRMEERLRRVGSSGSDTSQTPVPATTKPVAATAGTPSPAPAAPPVDSPKREPESAPEPEGVAPFEDAPPQQALVEVPAPAAPPAEFDLRVVDEKWPAIVARIRDEAGPRRFAFFREARPAAVDGSTLVLEIPEQFKFHLDALSEDDRLNGIVVAVLSDVLGGSTRVAYRSGAVSVEPDVTTPDPSRAPDESDMDESTAGAIDPTDLVVDLLGGEVVE
jgi:DNA polymerase III subunit gamma/tau